MKLGMLYSLSGVQAEMEQSILDGAMLAVHQINARGGVLGCAIEVAIYDDQSEVSSTARGVDHLCRVENVDAIVGGYTSAARLALIPAIHSNSTLLMYPTYFEGEETDPRIFYCGAAPNQYVADYLAWIADTLGRRVYVVGSDYIYPRVLSEAIRRLAGRLGIEVVGDRYSPIGETRFEAIIDDIAAKQPSVVISNLVSTDSTTAFYTQYHLAGFTAETTPIAATVTTELDLAHMPTEVSDGHYMVATYFSGLSSGVNADYRRQLLEVRGQVWSHAVQVGAFNAVHALALAAETAGSLDHDDLSRALIGIRFDDSPEGAPFFFRANHYSAHPAYIGRAEHGRYSVIREFDARLPDPWWSGSDFPAAVDPASGRLAET
ncbi:putative ABC transporter substrate-binding protein [Gordonia paraffinivorans NBRC 108238]|uniref:ABC transporter substrate-binding protein n=7 Tax=Gordonia paraffinivorans TaxID=175628 RepID=A0ABQ0IM99_9ACTN|nr:transporter substrate-binding protein [Gordonia paraffinivorans]GAC84528.1 putative ABC transporter substrate-binding protein [Gordonia paraffinivorans NBRC 108238]